MNEERNVEPSKNSNDATNEEQSSKETASAEMNKRDLERLGASIEDAQKEEPRRFWQSPFFWVAMFFILMMPLLRIVLLKFSQRIPEAPPVYGQLNDFSLKDHEGKPFGKQRLMGRVTFVKFFFTRCPTICPRMMYAMRRLQKGFLYHKINEVQFVSITVDPGHDTPEKLRAYAKKYKVKMKNWSFVTGAEKDVFALSRQQFKTAVGKQEGELMEISHSGKLILVDQQARIRGYFSITKVGLQKAFQQARALAWSKFLPKSTKPLKRLAPPTNTKPSMVRTPKNQREPRPTPRTKKMKATTRPSTRATSRPSSR